MGPWHDVGENKVKSRLKSKSMARSFQGAAQRVRKGRAAKKQLESGDVAPEGRKDIIGRRGDDGQISG